MDKEHDIFNLFNEGNYKDAIRLYGAKQSLEYATTSLRHEASVMGEILEHYRKFIHTLYDQSSGGPPVEQLIDCVENGTINSEAIGHFMAGFPFTSYSEKPLNVELM